MYLASLSDYSPELLTLGLKRLFDHYLIMYLWLNGELD